MQIPNGKVVWYVVGRFYTDANDNAFDAGYFPFIDGLSDFFVKGATENESSAYFTFYADKFTGTALQNGNVAATLFPPGDWCMYCIDTPAGNWQQPDSFKGSETQKIATWSRVNTTMSTTIGTASLSLLTFQLKASSDFEWQGKVHNVAKLFPNGVTQMGFGSPELLDPLANYPYIKAFTATATKI